MRQLARLRRDVESWQKLRQRVADARDLADLDDDALLAELTQEVDQLEIEVDRRETQALLSGPHDADDAILAIHAGAGGTDSQDWAAMLQRMYLRWMENKDYDTVVLDQSEGEEAGIRSRRRVRAGTRARPLSRRPQQRLVTAHQHRERACHRGPRRDSGRSRPRRGHRWSA